MAQPTQGKKLLEQMRDPIRVKQYSFRTEKTYLHWVREYFLYKDDDDLYPCAQPRAESGAQPFGWVMLNRERADYASLLVGVDLPY